MYPRNNASPEPVAIGAVVLIADGTVQTSGVTVRIKPVGVAEGDGAGTTAYSTDGVVEYTPTQAETNYTSFILIAKKTGCIPVSATVVTSKSGTAGYAGLDWGQVLAPTTTVDLSGTTIKTTQKVDVDTIKTNPVVNAGTVTFPTGATLASTTNITAGTIATVTNLTNAPTAGDFTAAMKTSLNAATPASVQNVAAQTGDAYARLGLPAGASVSADVAAVKADTGNLVTRITSTLFSGITSLAQWLGLLAGKQTGNSTARTELRATGAGSGAFDETTDSQEALRDRGDSAWVTATGFSTLTSADVTAALAAGVNVTEIGGSPTGLNGLALLGAAYGAAGVVDANVTKVSGSATAADNLALAMSAVRYAQVSGTGTTTSTTLSTSQGGVTAAVKVGAWAIDTNTGHARRVTASTFTSPTLTVTVADPWPAAQANGAQVLFVEDPSYADAGTVTALAAGAITAAALADGAITDAKVAVPAEAAGRPTGILGMVRRLFEWRTNKRVRDRSTGAVTLRNAADSATLETQTESTATVGSVTTDTITKGA